MTRTDLARKLLLAALAGTLMVIYSAKLAWLTGL